MIVLVLGPMLGLLVRLLELLVRLLVRLGCDGAVYRCTFSGAGANQPIPYPGRCSIPLVSVFLCPFRALPLKCTCSLDS